MLAIQGRRGAAHMLWQLILARLARADLAYSVHMAPRPMAPRPMAPRPMAPRPMAPRPMASVGPGEPAVPTRGLAGLDLPLLLRLRAGDPDAQRAYLDHFWPDLEREVRRYARRGGPADDLLGEGALALWEAAFQYDPRKHRTDVEHFVTNHVHRRVRRAYRKAMGYDQARVVPLEQAADQPASDPGFDARADLLDLARAQAALLPAERETLHQYLGLVAGAGLGPDQAAHHLARQHGGTPAAWKKRLQRTRKKMAALMQPHQ
jgi:DNA-directed RNA polymerase specialized sigma24 family protein